MSEKMRARCEKFDAMESRNEGVKRGGPRTTEAAGWSSQAYIININGVFSDLRAFNVC